MLCRMKSHLHRVLQDTLTSHLGLSNSSVSVTDELAQNVQAAQRGISHDRLCLVHPLHNVYGFQWE